MTRFTRCKAWSKRKMAIVRRVLSSLTAMQTMRRSTQISK